MAHIGHEQERVEQQWGAAMCRLRCSVQWGGMGLVILKVFPNLDGFMKGTPVQALKQVGRPW